MCCRWNKVFGRWEQDIFGDPMLGFPVFPMSRGTLDHRSRCSSQGCVFLLLKIIVLSICAAMRETQYIKVLCNRLIKCPKKNLARNKVDWKVEDWPQSFRSVADWGVSNCPYVLIPLVSCTYVSKTLFHLQHVLILEDQDKVNQVTLMGIIHHNLQFETRSLCGVTEDGGSTCYEILVWRILVTRRNCRRMTRSIWGELG